MTARGNLVAGEWIAGADTNRNVNPSNLDDVVGEYARADAAQVTQAIAAAAGAAPGWARGNLQERADLLDRIGDTILRTKTELGTLLSREEGKTLPEGIGEASRAGYIFKFFAGEVVRLPGETQAGMVMVNLPTAGVDYHVPFGGRKASSYGPREQGRYAVEFYTTVKTAYTAP
jgi:aldehyde dehydrogenase (NAD+)